MTHQSSETVTELDLEAETWLVQLTSREASAEDFAAARAWCAKSPAHREAFGRARRFWRHAGPTLATRRTEPQWSRRRSLAAAAVVTLAIGLTALAAHLDWTADYRTSVTGPRRVTLEDGSSILLDTETALDVQYTSRQRLIHLRRGQALFDVARDEARPFVVSDGELTATALGTVYAVRRDDSGSRVTVREGRVAVAGHDIATLNLAAGEHASYSGSRLSRDKIDAEQVLAWERGLLICKLTPLAEVIDELNRHRAGVILIGDARLRELRVSGVFRLDDADETLAALTKIFPIEPWTLSGYVVVLRHRE